MKLTLNTDSYNERRYGKPSTAKIDFSSNKNGDFLWGKWIGEIGEEGLLELDNVNVGDVIARGQKDTRKSANSAPLFYIIENEKGDLRGVSKIEAYKHFISNNCRVNSR